MILLKYDAINIDEGPLLMFNLYNVVSIAIKDTLLIR